MKRISYLRHLVCLFLGIFLFACDQEDLKVDKPSYLYIDTTSFETIRGQGTAHQRFTDVWVNVNGETKGVFELPAKVPVLSDRPDMEIRLTPGIIENGISNTRAPYAFAEPYVVNRKTNPGGVDTISVQSRYSERTRFIWSEDFERLGTASDLYASGKNNAILRKTSNQEEVFEGDYSYTATLNDEQNFFEVETQQAFLLQQGRAIFLELHYKSDITIAVGYISFDPIGQVLQYPIVYLNPREEWGKVYINFGYDVNQELIGTRFDVFFGAINDSGEERKVFLDNIKLLSL